MAIDNELEKRRLGLEFANKLSMLAAEAPDVFSELAVHELAKTIRKRFTYSKDLRKKEIMTWLKRRSEHGGMSTTELTEETGYHKDVIYELTKELESEGLVELRPVQSSRDDGRGRPAIRYFASSRAIFSVRKS